MIVSTRRANILEQDDLVISSQMDKFLKPCTQKHYSNSHGQDCFHVHCCAFSGHVHYHSLWKKVFNLKVLHIWVQTKVCLCGNNSSYFVDNLCYTYSRKSALLKYCFYKCSVKVLFFWFKLYLEALTVMLWRQNMILQRQISNKVIDPLTHVHVL